MDKMMKCMEFKKNYKHVEFDQTHENEMAFDNSNMNIQ